MGGSMFGPHRRERIAFCGKFEGARLGRLKEGLGRSKKTHFRKKMKNGRGECGFGPHSESGSRFLQKTAKHGLGTVKQGRSAANQCILAKKHKKHFKMEWAQACLDCTGVSGLCF